MKKLMALIVGLVFVGMVGSASAFTLDLYETIDNTPGGTPSDNGPVVPIPTGLGTGFVIILDNNNDNSNQNNWSDVLDFTDGGVQLRSDVNDAPNPLWPSYSSNFFFLLETGTVTDYCGFCTEGSNHYLVHSGEDTRQTPEPATMLLLGGGLVGLRMIRRRRNQD
jgi:hypothetical protein